MKRYRDIFLLCGGADFGMAIDDLHAGRFGVGVFGIAVAIGFIGAAYLPAFAGKRLA